MANKKTTSQKLASGNLTLTTYQEDKMPRTYKNVEGYGLQDGMLCITTFDGVQRTRHVLNMAYYLGYDADVPLEN